MIEVYLLDNKYYIHELIYLSKLTSVEVVNLIKSLNIDKTIKIYADTARPEINEDIKRAGFKIEGADKKSIKAGIDTVRSSEIYIYDSPNILMENKTYIWKTVNGKLTETPIDYKNHLLDAIRYALHTHKTKGKITGKMKIY